IPPDLLHPPDIQLQVRAARVQRIQAAFRAPGQIAAQVGLGVVAGGALEMVHTVRTGKPAWEQVFGQPFWDWLDANPAISASFDATMAVDAGNVAVADCYDWTTVRHAADIGCAARWLTCRKPRPVPRSTWPGSASTAGARSSARASSDPLPPGADAYLLSRVIHDWDDAAATAILRRCAEAAGSTGRVLVIESHGTPGGDPAAFAEMNLRMLVLTGGRERTIDDYSALAAGAGLQVTAVHDITERHVIIECVPT